ncbi:MAG: cell wall protein [Myxococcaceae bacterium]
MSVERAFRDIIRDEIQSQLRPFQSVLAQLQTGTDDLAQVRTLVEGLKPLASLLGMNLNTSARGSGRQPKALNLFPTSAGPKLTAKGSVGRRATNDRPCAIIGCRRDSRTKGYCAAHYQKLRMLIRTKRLPGGWKEFAPAQSVEDVVLPRGRAGAQALRTAREKK